MLEVEDKEGDENAEDVDEEAAVHVSSGNEEEENSVSNDEKVDEDGSSEVKK